MTLLIFTYRFQSKKPLISLSRHQPSADLKNRTKLDLNDIKALIELYLSKCYFLWEDIIYLLNDSAPIGLVLMVVIAEAYHEKNAIDAALRENLPFAPKSFVQYLEDSHARFKNLDSATAFQRILNQKDLVNIKYTMDTEDNQVPAVP